MEGRYYVFSITLTSSGAEDRKLTPYDDLDTAQRKYHEAFNGIGGGPQFISCAILDRYMNFIPGYRSYWQKQEVPPEEA